jgi:hypothetical protein
MIWMAAVAVDRDRGGSSSSGDDENDRNGRNGRNGEGSGRNSANWEVGWIIGTDGEGTMSDDDGTGAEATAEGF